MNILKPMLAQLRAENVVRKLIGDGGPGSGNWGHRGRPGKVGGSGPGGGSQYRGGRSDIGYFNSKSDWLNGLTGEKQQTATRILNSVKKSMPASSQNTPEEHIMKHMPIEARRTLVDLVGEARAWDKRGWALQAENLDKDESFGLWNLGTYLDKKYAAAGETIFSDQEIRNSNFDEKWGLLTPEEQEFYLDMKAKACGLPTSGKSLSEYSKPFQKEIGVLEEASLPLSDEENKGWSDFLTRSEKEQITKELKAAFGENADFDYLTDMNAVEQTILDKLKNEAGIGIHGGEHAEEMFKAVTKYLKDKDEFVNGKFFEGLANVPAFYSGGDDGYGRLGRYEAYAVRNILEEWAKEKAPDKTISENGQEIEDGFLADEIIPPNAKAAYLSLKAVALGMSTEGISTYGPKRTLQDLTAMMKSERERVEKEAKRKKEIDSYNSEKKKGDVVIKGDAFSEEINSMRNESGSYTSEEYHKIGERVYTEFEKTLNDRQKQIDELNKKIDELTAPKREELRKLREAESHTLSDIFALENKYSSITRPYTQKLAELRRQSPIVDVLSRVRKLGPANPKDMKAHLPGRSSVKQFVEERYKYYPREWVERSLKAGTLDTKKVGRGYYNNAQGIMAISGSYDDECRETATHELAHRFEYTVPGIVEMEREFFEKRTQGEEFVPLRDLTGNKSYKSDERAKKDNFVNPYIGRDNGGNSFEVVSMGFTYAFHNPKALMGDKDYAQLMLGILAVG